MNNKSHLAFVMGWALICFVGAQTGWSQESRPASDDPPIYVLSANDVVLVKVYRQPDLESRLRISKDGTATFPLLGTVQLGGKTLDEAAGHIRQLLADGFLVNPQVAVTVAEYAKRRFTVLGQVARPGSYEIPSEESVNLLTAIAMSGGFTRLASTSKISVTRTLGEKKTIITLDSRDTAKESKFFIQQDDIITVPQRIF